MLDFTASPYTLKAILIQAILLAFWLGCLIGTLVTYAIYNYCGQLPCQ